MKSNLYPKLAWNGICKNKRLYLPYILSGSVMVMTYYILCSFFESPALSQMAGGSVLWAVLVMGCVVIAFFSILFLFYTNSFLIRQRYREFGLYNILGMDKRNIGRIMVWENLFVALCAIGTGLTVGVMLSKAAELLLLNLLNLEITYSLHLGHKALCQTSMIYSGIYFGLLLNSLMKVRRTKPLELMRTDKMGERIPKYNWVFGIAGIALLGGAYYLSVTSREPLAALNNFFIAVLMVIAGTYLLFISGSVVFCRLLQKNKKYYYKANHFVSVSSMVYRMKRNGAGLASICILLTMVLVMISSTTSLYIGEEHALNVQYPNDISITLTFDNADGINDENLAAIREKIRQSGKTDADLIGTRVYEIPGLITQDGIIIDSSNHTDYSVSKYYNLLGYLSVISTEDYNNMSGANATLADDECLLYCDRLSYHWDTFTMEYADTYRVREHLKEFWTDNESYISILPTVHLVVNDVYAFSEPIKDMKNSNGDPMMTYLWRCGFDVDTAEAELAAATAIRELLLDMREEGTKSIRSHNIASRNDMRKEFYDLYGSLFFLGITLSIVFLVAAVLIIYYKQISEGYEDQRRFEIMQKVGMTRRDIRRSINSQMLTVFFLPLFFAGCHIAFALPFIVEMLLLFGMNDAFVTVLVSIACFSAFGMFYAIVYKATSNAYFSIVSGAREK